MTLLSRLRKAERPSREWWLVQHRDGWCATKTGMRPAEAATSVPTLCGQFVILPSGYGQDADNLDCQECIAAIQSRTGG